MTLRPLKVVLTATGCPGASTLIRMLKGNGEREIVIHGVDTRGDAVGRFLCDSFDTVPPGASPDYIPALTATVEREQPDVLFVQSSHEVGYIARHKAVFEGLGAKVLVADPEPIDVCNDKAAMHAALQGAPVPQPELLLPASLDEFVAGCRQLGYPGVPVCFKPPVAKGSRGFRILSSRVDRVHQLLHERPVNRYMSLDEFVDLFTGVEPFPTLMLMEAVEGPEYTVDALVDHGEIMLCQVKTREIVETGLAMAFRTVDRPDLVETRQAHLQRARPRLVRQHPVQGRQAPRGESARVDVRLPGGLHPALRRHQVRARRAERGRGARAAGPRARHAPHRALLRPDVLGRVRTSQCTSCS